MKKDEIFDYFDDLLRLARTKCTEKDAEDAVSETFLAAVAYLERGGEILYPKTWLANTLMHKVNSALRRQYRMPEVVNLDAVAELPGEEGDWQVTEEEERRIRQEVNYLCRLNREVVIRYYFRGERVAEIAHALGIPEGTVKSRLFAGREQIRKGFDMAIQRRCEDTDVDNRIPGRLNFSWTGEMGSGDRPVSLVWGDLIAQNLLAEAYERPLTSGELGRRLGIPTAYIEPILDRLTDGELMVKTGERYYTDFILHYPEAEGAFEAQHAFASERFGLFWSVLADALGELDRMVFAEPMNDRQRMKLRRFAALDILQHFSIHGGGAYLPHEKVTYPNRKDGGKWFAISWYFPGDYKPQRNRYDGYKVLGGHRTSCCAPFGGTAGMVLHEFDTMIWDYSCRWNLCGNLETYTTEIQKLLWAVHTGCGTEGISTELLAATDEAVKVGLLAREDGVLSVDIPLLTEGEYDEVHELVMKYFRRMNELVGADFAEFLRGRGVRLPEHLEKSGSVPEFLRYGECKHYIELSVLEQAREEGLFMQGVDYVCPPVVLVYKK